MTSKTKKAAKPVPEARRTFFIVGVYAIAMGFLEAIVVVYLRQIYYPQGFDFPLTLLSPEMLSVEWIRETATLIMLVTIGMIAGKNSLQRLLYFLYSFGIWDIFYYAALYLLLGWPSSLLTWDILFLIPVPWIGPVASPVICSVTMILMALTITLSQENGRPVRIRIYDWMMIFGGAAIIFFTYIRDYLRIISKAGMLSHAGDLQTKEKLWAAITSYIPENYSWLVFFMGEILILCALFMILRRVKSMTHASE